MTGYLEEDLDAVDEEEDDDDEHEEGVAAVEDVDVELPVLMFEPDLQKSTRTASLQDAVSSLTYFSEAIDAIQKLLGPVSMMLLCV